MGKHNFDLIIDRKGSGAVKCDGLDQLFGCNNLCPMWIADMDFPVADEIQEALIHRFKHPIYGYNIVPSEFWESICRWLKRRHNWNVSNEEITFMPGVVKAIGYVINFFTEVGDKIVIQPPVYHPFKNLTVGNKRTLVNNPLISKGDTYEMDFEGLERIFRDEKPKLMILCNPHNPVGIQWSKSTLQKVASLAKTYGVIVVSDEIHGDLMLDGRTHFPFASVSDDAAEVAITLGAPSKTFNIAGLVSSWCIIKNPAIRNPFFEWMTVNEFNEPTFVAIIGTITAYNNGESWLDDVLSYIHDNIDFVQEQLDTHLKQVKMIRPEASFMIWLDCRGLGLDHDGLVDLFVNKARLALNDGAMFGSEGDGFMRLNVGCPRSIIADALKSLAGAVKELQAN